MESDSFSAPEARCGTDDSGPDAAVNDEETDMLPLALDITTWPVLAVGRGAALHKRLALLDGAKAADVTCHLPEAADIEQAAGQRVIARLPEPEEIAACRLLLAAGLTDAEEIRIGGIARAHRVLLNIEDRLPWCDFHVPALVRRGDLLLAISTGGRSPAAATVLRAWLERRFPAIWARRLAEAGTLRDRLRAEGKGPGEVGAAVRALPFLAELARDDCAGRPCLRREVSEERGAL